MGKLDGIKPEDVKAIMVAEIGAQGASNIFRVFSKNAQGEVKEVFGSYGYTFGDIKEDGDVSAEEIAALCPEVAKSHVFDVHSMLRGFSCNKDESWFHFDATFGHHVFVCRELSVPIAKIFGVRPTARFYECGREAILKLLTDESEVKPSGAMDA